MLGRIEDHRISNLQEELKRLRATNEIWMISFFTEGNTDYLPAEQSRRHEHNRATILYLAAGMQFRLFNGGWDGSNNSGDTPGG